MGVAESRPNRARIAPESRPNRALTTLRHIVVPRCRRVESAAPDAAESAAPWRPPRRPRRRRPSPPPAQAPAQAPSQAPGGGISGVGRLTRPPVNQRSVLGSWANSTILKVVSEPVTAIGSLMALVLVGETVLGWFGVR